MKDNPRTRAGSRYRPRYDFLKPLGVGDGVLIRTDAPRDFLNGLYNGAKLRGIKVSARRTKGGVRVTRIA